MRFFSTVGGQLSRGSAEAAGMDIRCSEDFTLPPARTVGYPNENDRVEPTVVKVKTGLHIEVPTGYVGILRERSGLGSKGIAVRAGVIDSDYRGEVVVCLQNLSSISHSFKKGDRIAQLVVQPYLQCEGILVTNVEELSGSERGSKGFGSSGLS